MNDISKCGGELDGKVCPVRQNCVRWLTPAGDLQSWVWPAKIGEKCQHYWREDEEPNDDN